MTEFIQRHIGITETEQAQMLKDLGLSSLDELVRQVVPDSILLRGDTNLPEPCSEQQALEELKEIAEHNIVRRSLIGQGYYGTITPSVILRNVFENPAWYTSYTPYQAEISQGRLEALFNYQTLVTELTGLPVANASLLDEGTAAAEAMILAYNNSKSQNKFIVDKDIFPQTLAVLQTRAEPLGIVIQQIDFSGSIELFDFEDAFGLIVQLPNNKGRLKNPDTLIRVADVYKCMKIVIVDPDDENPDDFLRQTAEALKMGGNKCVVIRGHGAYCVGEDLDDAWANAAMLEHSMKIVLLARQANLKI